MNPPERSIERVLSIAAPRSRVFRALMDPGALSRWLFAAVTLTPEPGSAYSFEWRDSERPATAQGEILELVPDRRLVLSWFMEADGVTSSAAFALEDGEAGSTLLRFTHGGLPQEREWEGRFRAVALEWDKVLSNLRFMLEEQGEGKHLFYFRAQTTMRAHAARAFRAWLTRSGLSAWMASDVAMRAEEGGSLTGTTLDTNRALEAQFHTIAPDRHLRMLWSEGGKRGLLGVSFWPEAEGVALGLTLRSFALLEGERPIVQALWDKRFQRLAAHLSRRPLMGPAKGTGEFTQSRSFEATPSRAWNALTDASLLRRWFVNWTDFEPRVGAEFAWLWNGYGEILGRVEEVERGEKIRFTWDLPDREETTCVTWKVEPDPTQAALCRIHLLHSGWGEGEAWERHRREHELGWTGVLAMLDFYLRHGAGKEKQEFLLRRELRLPPDQTTPLFHTAEGLKSWLSQEASVEPRIGGAFAYTTEDGRQVRGRLVSLHSSGEGAVEFEDPEPALLEWVITPGSSPGSSGSRVDLTFVAYSGEPDRLAAPRAEWVAALDRLVARG